MSMPFVPDDRIAELHRKIAAFGRKMEAIERVIQRSEHFLAALDWSAMTVEDIDRVGWRGQDLQRDLWLLDTAQSDAWLEYWSLTS